MLAIGCVLLAALLGFFGWTTIQLIEIKVGLTEVRVTLKDTIADLRRRLNRVERHVGIEEDQAA